MMLPEFELLKPMSLDEALDLLAHYGPDARPIAGGTNVLIELREDFAGPPVLVEIGRLPELRNIEVTHDGAFVTVGSAVTIAELLRHPLIAEYGGPLKQSAAVFASPLVRNRATIGGNLVDASPAADTAPPLLALGAQVELSSTQGTRCIPLVDFFTGVRKTLRRPDELLTRIYWPANQNRIGAFHKFGLRRADAISVISASVVVEPDGAGPRRTSIALGAVAPRPIRVPEAERLLCNSAWTPQLMAEAAHMAAQHTSPIDDIRGSAAYRRHITEVIVQRLLTRLLSQIAPGGTAQ